MVKFSYWVFRSTLKHRNMIKDLQFISGLQPNLAKFFLGMIASLTAKNKFSTKKNSPCLLVLVGPTGFRSITKTQAHQQPCPRAHSFSRIPLGPLPDTREIILLHQLHQIELHQFGTYHKTSNNLSTKSLMITSKNFQIR